MATRQQRLSAFQTDGSPAAGQPVELLCEDHIGTYVIPFPCHWADAAWRSIKTGEPIEARVVGWRTRAAE
jgi:hypothetical protein